MKVIVHENSIELVPETEFEKQSLKQIAGKPVVTKWTDDWNQTGNLKIETQDLDWGT